MATARTSDAITLPRLFIGALVVVAVFTWAMGLPADGLRLLPCPVLWTTGLECPGCGMTRACIFLARGDLASSYELHPFALPLVSVALLAAFWPTRTREAWSRLPGGLRRFALFSAALLLLVRWVSVVG